MVSIAVLKLTNTGLVLVKPGDKLNGAYYRDGLMSEQLLPAIRHITGDSRLPAGWFTDA